VSCIGHALYTASRMLHHVEPSFDARTYTADVSTRQLAISNSSAVTTADSASIMSSC
jgi:hypothetical protein